MGITVLAYLFLLRACHHEIIPGQSWSIFQLRLDLHSLAHSSQRFEEAMSSYPEVMECYLMTGASDYMLRVVVTDLEAYQRFLLDRLTQIPGVANIQSSFALKQVQYKTALLLTPS